jgi:carbonic anhydrase
MRRPTSPLHFAGILFVLSAYVQFGTTRHVARRTSTVAKQIHNRQQLPYVTTTPANAQNVTPHWSYHEDNTDEIPPQEWESLYPTCNGSRESPIAIDKRTVKTDHKLGPLKLSSEKPIGHKWTVVNNGHSVQFSGSDFKNVPEISGGGLDGPYVFTQFHFHWGAKDSRGSEHVINGHRYPLELHIVHRKKSDNASYASIDSSGMAVVSVLFTIGKVPHDQLDKLIAAVIKVADKPGNPINITLRELDLADFIPKSPSAYYRYIGSLTTPPCSEAVVWTVLEKPQTVTERQLEIFRHLHEQAGRPTNAKDYQEDVIEDNFRPLQALDGRVVKQYKP